jgi:hypothetical protein
MSLPAALPTAYANSTAQQNNHPTAHNSVNAAVNELADHVQAALARTTSSVAPPSPWTGTYYLTKVSNVIHCACYVTRPTALTVDGGFAMGTIPAGFRPVFGSVWVNAATHLPTPATVEAGSALISIATSGSVTVSTRVVGIIGLAFSASWSAV